MIRRGPESRGEAGVTLVELLVTIVLFAVVGTATLGATVSMTRAERRADEVQTVLDTSRVALDRVRRDLRGARRVLDDPSGRHLQFWLDRDADDVVDGGEVVHYRLVADGATARLETWAGATAPRVVVRGLALTTPFSYDQASPATRLVGVTFTVAGDAGGTASAQVRLRNVE